MNRIEKLQRYLASWSVDALMIENPVDLLYLTGLVLSRGRLIIDAGKAHLYVDGRYFAEASMRSLCSCFLLEKGKGFEKKGLALIVHGRQWQL